MEAAYIAWRLPSWHGNLKKRLVKTPKLYFTDTGLVCYLLGIRSAEQLLSHPLRGAIFETWILGELRKQIANAGHRPDFHFYRDQKGLEVDLLVARGDGGVAIEVKSAETFHSAFFDSLDRLKSIPGLASFRTAVVYGGDQSQTRSRGTVIPWFDAAGLLESLAR